MKALRKPTVANLKHGISILLILLICSMLTREATAQEDEIDKSFPAVPERAPVPVLSKQENAWEAFQNKNVDWQIRWGSETRVPRSILGSPLEVAGGTPVEKARQFLQDNKALLGIVSPLEELSLVSAESREKATHVVFQQMHRGVPVEGAVYAVHLTNAGKVYYASGDYYDNIGSPEMKPSLTQAQAISAAATDLQRDLSSSVEVSAVPEEELVLLPYGNEFLLAWKLAVETQEPDTRWVYYISASNGAVLTGFEDADTFFHGDEEGEADGHIGEKSESPHFGAEKNRSAPAAQPSAVVRATAQGQVYFHHPEAGGIVTKTLTNLFGNGYRLDGNYVEVFNADAATAYESDGTFYYSTSNTHFDEVMVYYHATEFQKYMGAEVAYPHLGYPGSTIQVQATVHYSTNFIAESVAPATLRFGDGDGTTFNKTSREDNVIAHEYMHLVTERITFDGLDGSSLEENAMDEAFSDYFGGTYADSPESGKYVAIPGPLRNLENNYSMSNWQGSGYPASNSYHEGSQVFSGALWDIRQQFGERIGNVLAFEGLDNLDQSAPNFNDGKEAIVAADLALYGGSHVCAIRQIFKNRGIGTACVSAPATPTGFNLTGNPGQHPKLTWSAVSGATGYKIYRCMSTSTSCTNFSYLTSTSSTTYTDLSRRVGTSCSSTSGEQFTFYYVKAYNSGGDSPASATKSTCTGNNKQGVADLTAQGGALETLPAEYTLEANYPNPFNPSTEIRFALPEAADVRLLVYDALGREVARLVDGPVGAGYQHATFEASGLPSGVYLYRLEAKGAAETFAKTGRMVLVK